MKHKPIIAFCLILFSLSYSFAQNPGYQGKHCVVSYGLSGMPFMGSWFGEDVSGDFNLRHTFHLEYTVHRNISLGLNFELINDITYIKNHSTSADNPLNELFNEVTPNPITEFKSAANFKGSNLGMFARFYQYKSFGSIAPLGSYIHLEFMLNNINISDDGRFYNTGQTNLHEINARTFIIGSGVQHIFFNRLTFDLSLNFGINSVGWKASDLRHSLISNSDKSEGSHFFREQENKLFSDYIFFTRIGVGWLLF